MVVVASNGFSSGFPSDFEYENWGALVCGPTGLAPMLLSEVEKLEAFGRGINVVSSTGSNFLIAGAGFSKAGVNKLYSI